MDNITVRDLIEQSVGMLVPTIIICEKGSGQIYSGPITTIPEQIKNRKYTHANVYPSTGELIVTVKEETK